jgi:two-component system response regulator HydG
VEAGRFREDLYYRLNVVILNVPPLKDRQEDIPLLARHYLSVFAGKNQKPMENFTPQALDRLLKYDWPGNVRELMNVVERAVVLSTSSYVDERILPPALREPRPGEAAPAERPLPSDGPLEEVEKAAVLRTLDASGGNKSEAARRLGITRRTLHKKLKKYGVMDDKA